MAADELAALTELVQHLLGVIGDHEDRLTEIEKLRVQMTVIHGSASALLGGHLPPGLSLSGGLGALDGGFANGNVVGGDQNLTQYRREGGV